MHLQYAEFAVHSDCHLGGCVHHCAISIILLKILMMNKDVLGNGYPALGGYPPTYIYIYTYMFSFVQAALAIQCGS